MSRVKQIHLPGLHYSLGFSHEALLKCAPSEPGDSCKDPSSPSTISSLRFLSFLPCSIKQRDERDKKVESLEKRDINKPTTKPMVKRKDSMEKR